MPKPLTDLIAVGGSILDKILPALGITDPEKRREAELKLKELAQSGELEEARLGLERLEAELSDRADARRMQRETKGWIAPALAILSFVGFFGALILLAFYEVPDGSQVLFQVLVITLQGIVFAVVGFYFGSSQGSKNKELMLNRALREDEKDGKERGRIGW